MGSTCPDQDIIAGVVAGYDFDQIKYWVNSLDRTVFSGLKLVLCADVEQACVRELERRNYTVVEFKRLELADDPEFIFKERFFQLWQTLKQLNASEKYRFIVFPDTKDVIFQYNPSKWLAQNMGQCALNVGSKSIRHRDEPWAKELMLRDYGREIYENMKDRLVYNAGTMAGKVRGVR